MSTSSGQSVHQQTPLRDLARDNRAFVRDFDSTNGTFVNDRQIKGEIELQQGDRLRSGRSSSPCIWNGDAGESTNAAAADQERADHSAAEAAATETKGRQDADAATKQPDTAKEGEAPPKPAFSTSSAKNSSADDDIAAMLLEMGDESSSGAFGGSDSRRLDGDGFHAAARGAGPSAKKEKEKEKPKPPANTQSAAKEILEKYMKRPR